MMGYYFEGQGGGRLELEVVGAGTLAIMVKTDDGNRCQVELDEKQTKNLQHVLFECERIINPEKDSWPYLHGELVDGINPEVVVGKEVQS